MGIHRAEQTIEILGAAEESFAAITDYETFPEWQEAVVSTAVLERYPDGLGKLVEVTADAKFREVTYRLHYHYNAPGRIWRDFVAGQGAEHIELRLSRRASRAGTGTPGSMPSRYVASVTAPRDSRTYSPS